jgi:hypothetical protein
MRRLAGDRISRKKMLRLTCSMRVLVERKEETPEEDSGVRVKGQKKAGKEEWWLACLRRTLDEDEDEENCIMTVLYI